MRPRTCWCRHTLRPMMPWCKSMEMSPQSYWRTLPMPALYPDQHHHLHCPCHCADSTHNTLCVHPHACHIRDNTSPTPTSYAMGAVPKATKCEPSMHYKHPCTSATSPDAPSTSHLVPQPPASHHKPPTSTTMFYVSPTPPTVPLQADPIDCHIMGDHSETLGWGNSSDISATKVEEFSRK